MDYPESLAVTRFSRKIIVPTYLAVQLIAQIVQTPVRVIVPKVLWRSPLAPAILVKLPAQQSMVPS